MAITIATADVSGLSISGYVPPLFTAIGCGYSVGHVELDTKSHWLTHSSSAAFGVMLYASGYGIGVATPAGMSLTDKYGMLPGGCVCGWVGVSVGAGAG